MNREEQMHEITTVRLGRAIGQSLSPGGDVAAHVAKYRQQIWESCAREVLFRVGGSMDNYDHVFSDPEARAKVDGMAELVTSKIVDMLKELT